MRTPPKVSVSPGSIKKMTQDGGTESPGKQTGAKSKLPEGAQKNGQRKQPKESDTTDISTIICAATEENLVIEPRQKKNCQLKEKWR